MIEHASQLRIARPVRDLEKTTEMYCNGLGLTILGRFENHAGFDGVILGIVGAAYHFEFTLCRHHPVTPMPTPEDLAVFYLEDETQWRDACESAERAGFKRVTSFNSYWEKSGRTYVDADGYRIVFQCGRWR